MTSLSGFSIKFNHPSLDSIFDIDAISYFNAVQAADSDILELQVKKAINSFIIGCKSDGIWDAIKASCILAGARTLAGALVPLKGSAPTNNGPFVSGDYDRKTGLKGNGSTKYLNSNRNNNVDPQNSKHGAVFVTDLANNLDATLFSSGNIGIAGRTGISNRRPLDDFVAVNQDTTTFQNIGVLQNDGFIGVSRNNSDNFTLRQNFTNTTVSRTSGTPNSGNIFIFARPAAPATAYTDSRIAFYSIGEALDLALLDARVSNLMDTLDLIL